MNCKWGRGDAEEDYYLVSRRIVEIGQAMGWVTFPLKLTRLSSTKIAGGLKYNVPSRKVIHEEITVETLPRPRQVC